MPKFKLNESGISKFPQFEDKKLAYSTWKGYIGSRFARECLEEVETIETPKETTINLLTWSNDIHTGYSTLNKHKGKSKSREEWISTIGMKVFVNLTKMKVLS